MVDVELVAELCRCATEAADGGVVDVVGDPLDGSVWVRMSSGLRAQQARTAVMAHGLDDPGSTWSRSSKAGNSR